ncbi:integrase-like protein [Aliidiomarina maris]|uniref:Integrase-like protein n=1 Tax=Aliidiomarina maris TaxID=531312 RepID=A0A327WN82_9GAMM|nr:integrase-like protein [Aliidiomarina maris]
MSWIREANQAGARLRLACDEVGISLRTYKRWYRGGKVTADKRPEAIRPEPMNKLSEYEQQVILDVCNESRFASLPPTQIVPALLDDGLYYGSESTYYRLLKQHGQLQHRGRSLAPRVAKAPETFTANGPRQVFCWDITYLPSNVRNQFFYLYMLEDLYSRPRVSNDNPFAESLFRTCKYRPEWPSAGFKSLDEAREWVLKFTRWYNYEHKHSKLRFVTPEQRHTGQDKAILAKRKAVMEAAKAQHSVRWGKRQVRNCTPGGANNP